MIDKTYLGMVTKLQTANSQALLSLVPNQKGVTVGSWQVERLTSDHTCAISKTMKASPNQI